MLNRVALEASSSSSVAGIVVKLLTPRRSWSPIGHGPLFKVNLQVSGRIYIYTHIHIYIYDMAHGLNNQDTGSRLCIKRSFGAGALIHDHVQWCSQTVDGNICIYLYIFKISKLSNHIHFYIYMINKFHICASNQFEHRP